MFKNYSSTNRGLPVFHHNSSEAVYEKVLTAHWLWSCIAITMLHVATPPSPGRLQLFTRHCQNKQLCNLSIRDFSQGTKCFPPKRFWQWNWRAWDPSFWRVTLISLMPCQIDSVSHPTFLNTQKQSLSFWQLLQNLILFEYRKRISQGNNDPKKFKNWFFQARGAPPPPLVQVDRIRYVLGLSFS